MKNFTHLLLLIIFWAFFVQSCKIAKASQKSKTAIEQKNDIAKEYTKVTETKRDGGQIATSIIPVNERERDEKGDIKELIQEIKDGGLTKTIYYKPDGRVNVECTADEIWSRIEERLNERDNTITETNIKAKEQEKTENFDSSFIIYIMLGIVLIALIGFLFLFRLLNQNTRAVTAVLERL